MQSLNYRRVIYAVPVAFSLFAQPDANSTNAIKSFVTITDSYLLYDSELDDWAVAFTFPGTLPVDVVSTKMTCQAQMSRLTQPKSLCVINLSSDGLLALLQGKKPNVASSSSAQVTFSLVSPPRTLAAANQITNFELGTLLNRTPGRFSQKLFTLSCHSTPDKLGFHPCKVLWRVCASSSPRQKHRTLCTAMDQSRASAAINDGGAGLFLDDPDRLTVNRYVLQGSIGRAFDGPGKLDFTLALRNIQNGRRKWQPKHLCRAVALPFSRHSCDVAISANNAGFQPAYRIAASASGHDAQSIMSPYNPVHNEQLSRMLVTDQYTTYPIQLGGRQYLLNIPAMSPHIYDYHMKPCGGSKNVFYCSVKSTKQCQTRTNATVHRGNGMASICDASRTYRLLDFHVSYFDQQNYSGLTLDNTKIHKNEGKIFLMRDNQSTRTMTYYALLCDPGQPQCNVYDLTDTKKPNRVFPPSTVVPVPSARSALTRNRPLLDAILDLTAATKLL